MKQYDLDKYELTYRNRKYTTLAKQPTGTVICLTPLDRVEDEDERNFLRVAYKCEKIYELLSAIHGNREIEDVLFGMKPYSFIRYYKFDVEGSHAIEVKEEGNNIVVSINDEVQEVINSGSALSDENHPVHRLVKYINNVYELYDCTRIKILANYTFLNYIIVDRV